ncbi:SusD/RagB family nutrient-binding outer membrane lipoprotein [Spirosoma sp. SC4-14]|uniref:SusD/RagB family nutrient-binding outer membrane lipoprotein n=1 Tax=Spirosoma sp. SC4-14 TaxID=3128900 RepID=UPI0030CA68C2
MKSLSYKISIGLVSLMLLSSCQSELDKLNKNPNNLEQTEVGPLLTNIVLNSVRAMTENGWTLGNGYGQYMTFSSSYYNLPTRYQPVSNDPVWNSTYGNARNAQLLYNLGVSRNNATVQAVALALRSHAFGQLTDLWGDIPFKNALQASTGNFTPAYDSQQVVYNDPDLGILASLRKADQLLASSTATIVGDPLYNGDPKAWRRFVNALRLRYLMRVSGKQDVASEIQQIVKDGNLMTNASQSASIAFQTAVPYVFPSLVERSGDFNVKYVSQLFYTVLRTTGDSDRLTLIAAPNSQGKGKSGFSFDYYGGMPLVSDASATQVDTASNFSSNFLAINNPSLLKERLITYAEQEFILAEAAQRGLITGSAQDYYNAGIYGAFAEWGLTNDQAASYLKRPNTSFDSSKAIQQIITQKWIVNFNVGFEGWVEYLRTGFPSLETGGNLNLNGGSIATRFLYPDPERTINNMNYNQELQSRMGGKETTTYKAWWAN